LAACKVPDEYIQVSPAALEHAFHLYKPVKPMLIKRGIQPRRLDDQVDYRTLDTVAWFTSHGLYRFPMENGKHSVVCPWAGLEHDISCDSDTVIWETSETGYPQFYCSHDHCEGRWMMDVIENLRDAALFCSSF
jgi:hypothetical protein